MINAVEKYSILACTFIPSLNGVSVGNYQLVTNKKKLSEDSKGKGGQLTLFRRIS